MDKNQIDQLILSSLSGEATANDIEELRDWLAENEEHVKIYDGIKTYWESSKLEVKPPSLDAAFQKLDLNPNKETPIHQLEFPSKSKRKSIRFWYSIAASIVAIVTVSALIIISQFNETETEEGPVAQVILKRNPKGQKLTTYLPDGSKVILNSQSTIKYLSENTLEERNVELQGEAFFEVKKDAIRPFRVNSGGITTTALGTSFNVSTKSASRIEIALVEGKVEVKNVQGKSIILAPGEQALAKGDGTIEVGSFEYLEKVGWKDGVLAFRDNTIGEIIAKIEDWYGVEVLYNESSNGNFHYTGNYDNETLEEVLNGISFVHQFKFSIEGDTVEIY